MRSFAVVALAAVASGPIRACSDHDRITVTWTIPSGPGTSGVDLVGCDGWDVRMGDGRLTAIPGEGACGIAAWRHDGGLTPPTDPVWLARTGDQHVDFDLMGGPIAGLGIAEGPRDDRIAVTSVIPGSNADEAGLRAGSLILAVDGVSTDGMTAAQFSRRGTGAPGTHVVVQFVDSTGEYHVADIERQRFVDPGQPITVTWSFPEGPGLTGVDQIGCEGWRVVHERAGELVVVPGSSRCGLVGWRDDGIHPNTDPVWLDPVVETQHVDFDLPSGPIGGLGIGIRPDLGAIEVTYVTPGSPAERAGLRVGSHIVELDGEPTHGMTAAQFSRRGTGAPGTMVRIRFATHIGDDIIADIERQRFPSR